MHCYECGKTIKHHASAWSLDDVNYRHFDCSVKIYTDVVFCSAESISIGTGFIEHLPARWELYVTIQEGYGQPFTQCCWFATKPTAKQIRAFTRTVKQYSKYVF